MLKLRQWPAWPTGVTLLVLLAWDTSGLDLPMARWFGGAEGFPLRNQFLLSVVLHEGARVVAWLGVLVLCVAVIQPFGPFTRLGFNRRLQLPASALLASGLIVGIKAFSATSCPWDLQPFGGTAQYLSHWAGWLRADGGSGRCFPAGHASTGFAFFGGYFVWRDTSPRLAQGWLVAALGSGLLLGLVQQARGAHFMSHTLWTGWLCWACAWLTDPLFSTRAQPSPSSL